MKKITESSSISAGPETLSAATEAHQPLAEKSAKYSRRGIPMLSLIPLRPSRNVPAHYYHKRNVRSTLCGITTYTIFWSGDAAPRGAVSATRRHFVSFDVRFFNVGYFVAALLLVFSFTRASFSQSKTEWGGYLQTRFSDDFHSNAGFSIRRAKLWIDGRVPDVTNLSFRMQGIFRYQTSGTFMLQDVYGEYKMPFGFVRAGQFVPDFSLERSQSDAYLPLIERAAVDNALIPSGDTYARDIGAELVLEPKESGFHTSFGIYNGNGGNTKSNEDRQFLYTNRTTYDIRFTGNLSWTNGFSVAYRDKRDLSFPSILGSGKTFSGTDFRWGLESHLKSSKWEIQGEYIQADLESQRNYGYYVFGGYDFDRLNAVVLSTEKLQVVNTSYANAPWYIVGYSHFFNGQRFKVMVDGRAQNVSDHSNYGGTLQLQIFLN